MGDSYSDILIVGGSVAATRAAEAAHRHAPHLAITVISDEAHAPYERPPLSKIPLDTEMELESLTYPVVAKLEESGVRFLHSTRAAGLDTEAKHVTTSGGVHRYGSLVIATGCDPVVPPQFVGQDNTFVLRTFADADALRQAVGGEDTSVAVIGAGFIGGEFAATLVEHGQRVSIVDIAPQPLGRFGQSVAQKYEQLHRESGVQLHLGRTAVDIVRDGGRRELLLDDGTRVPADVVLLGVGVRPATQWLEGSGLALDNGVVCDENLAAGEGIFAAGDLVRWPNTRFGSVMRIEHWTTAAEQGRIAGINAVNNLEGNPLVPCSTVPYFWSDQHRVRIQFAGYLTGEETVTESHNEQGSLYFYSQGHEVTAVLAFERRQEFVKIRAALRKPLDVRSARTLLEAAGPRATE